jgi:hypothetical protein
MTQFASEMEKKLEELTAYGYSELKKIANWF